MGDGGGRVVVEGSLDVDHYVSTAYCYSFPGNEVDLLLVTL